MKLKFKLAKFFEKLSSLFRPEQDDEDEWFEDYPVGVDRIPESVWKKRVNQNNIKEQP